MRRPFATDDAPSALPSGGGDDLAFADTVSVDAAFFDAARLPIVVNVDRAGASHAPAGAAGEARLLAPPPPSAPASSVSSWLAGALLVGACVFVVVAGISSSSGGAAKRAEVRVGRTSEPAPMGGEHAGSREGSSVR